MTLEAMFKRVFDFALAALLLLLAAPVLVLCIVAIHLEDGRPWFFRQSRIGLGGATFTIYKLRSMRSMAGPKVTISGDVRITRTGRILRNMKFDELPQLFNVLKGDMSLVGPRPEVAEYMTAIDPQKAALRNSVRPGITGPTSLAFADEETMLQNYADPVTAYREIIFPEKLELDLKYVAEHSVWSDLTIVFKTAISILKRALKPS